MGTKYEVDNGNLSLIGNMRIGSIAAANAPIQFNNVTGNKVRYYETANNDHQIYGASVAGSQLIYQVDASTTNHVFRSGINSSSSLDLFRVMGTRGVQFPNSSVASYTPSTLEYFEEFTHVTNIGGAIASQSYSIKIVRINKTVFLKLPVWTATATSSSTVVTSSSLPARFLPTATVIFVAAGARNTALAILVSVDNTGIIRFFGDSTGGNFTNGLTAQFSGSCPFYDTV